MTTRTDPPPPSRPADLYHRDQQLSGSVSYQPRETLLGRLLDCPRPWLAWLVAVFAIGVLLAEVARLIGGQ